MRFNQKLDQILHEATNEDYKAAVAIVQDGTRWLLGLSTANDDRNCRWCFPGGGVKRGEDADRAAAREAWEETGVRCRPIGTPFSMPGRKGVAFVHCKETGGELDPNSEFAALGWFTRKEMKALKLFDNVTKLIDRVT